MTKFKNCFIKDNESYREIPYTALFIGKERNPEYANRYFLPFHGYLLEVPFEDYQEEYQDMRRRKYLHKEAQRNGEISYDALDSEEMNGNEIIRDIYTDVERDAISQVLITDLRQALKRLTEDELELIESLYYQEKSERQYAAVLGISQKGVNKRRRKILDKLRALIEKY